MKIKVVDDPAIAEEIRQKIRENDGYCPCRVKKTPDTKCICKQFLESKKEGYCHCGLYYKVKE